MRIFFILCFFFCEQLSAQIVVNGYITDNSTGEGLAYVNVYIKGTSKGVISNSDGKFSIFIPVEFQKEELVISYIGYETVEIRISDLKIKLTNSIKLKTSAFNLDKVVLIYKKLDVNDIIKKAFKNYKNNFPDKPFISKAFLRHTEKTKKEYKWLVEAAIEIYDPGFNDNPQKIKTNVVEVRKSFDNRYVDTLTAYKLYSKHVLGKSNGTIWSKNFNLDNVPKREIEKAINYYDNFFTLRGWQESFFYSLLSTDYNKIRFYNRNNAILDNQILKKHVFKLDTVLLENEIKIYKIKILPTNPPASLNRFKKNKELPVGWIYIRSTDFAIIELKYSLLENTKESKLNSKIHGSRITSIYHIKFIDFDGKMYPKYLSVISPKGNRFIESLDGLNPKETIIDEELHYFTKEEILFNEHIIKKEVIDEYLKKSWDDNLFISRKHNSNYWDNYNILLESEGELELIKDLEKNVSLKKQFEQQ
ncbi:carboxypeptidase-like regulatory domain-containing protein [Yeosuana sp.]|uniref:carboxypeptidase-like regulatory domain-containing protein n=1 Tax=Yeosuana sp. TaxID=2529388 RepID=UPI004054DC45